MSRTFADAYPEGYASDIEKLCDWVSNFRGAKTAHAGRRGHRAYHFGCDCPYHVVAEILRGKPDPRRVGTTPEPMTTVCVHGNSPATCNEFKVVRESVATPEETQQ